MIHLWYSKVWQPYIAGSVGESELLLDDYICHKDNALHELMKADNTYRWLVPLGCTSTAQAFDADINKPLKDRLKEYATCWIYARISEIIPGKRQPYPKRKYLLD